MKTKIISALLTAAALTLSIAAHASPITLTFTAKNADLTLGSTAYDGVNFSVSMFADTTDLDTTKFGPSTPSYDNLTATMSISGGPSVTFPVYVFNNQEVQAVGFGNNATLDLFDLKVPGVGLSSYELTTAFGPISTSDVTALNQWSDLATSGGSMTVSSVALGSFQAMTGSSVPEPGTFGLLGIGLLGLLLASRRRENRA